MSLNQRLNRLEQSASAQQDQEDRWLTEEDCLLIFEDCERRGYMAGEPDFPRALAEYRAAIEKAKAQTDPPWDPPNSFMPTSHDLPDLRLLNWRGQFREVQEALSWLLEFLERWNEGKSAVTEAEFHELEGWYSIHEDRLYHLSLPSQLINLGDGRTTTTANIRYGLRRGPRASGVTALVEDLRRLRTLHAQHNSIRIDQPSR